MKKLMSNAQKSKLVLIQRPLIRLCKHFSQLLSRKTTKLAVCLESCIKLLLVFVA